MAPRPGTSRQAVWWPGRPCVRSSWRRASRRRSVAEMTSSVRFDGLVDGVEHGGDGALLGEGWEEKRHQVYWLKKLA